MKIKISKYPRIVFKLILKIILIGIIFAFFSTLLWITTTGEFNPPTIKNLLIGSLVISAAGHILGILMKMHGDKIERFTNNCE